MADESGTRDGDENVIAKLANEYATIWLEVDRTEANGPRLKILSLRDHDEVYLDPTALSLLCQVDEVVLGLLADIARDSGARRQFHDWVRSVHGRLVVPEDLTAGTAPEGDWAAP